ncbi:alpha-2-macroglobulin family protein [Mucilaginibacter psychrotolerans]|uniref:Carboxypeptidase regulatory-like domain-containing protein n=1 Tax=Mucilaginibacter psychrotolerans TaxID=1524096 RepID=A0A4Y8S5V4_9SPHI|nr:carboxypeptidase regulatory-like domain-containing protein [Mucilaginibacter psychrotolerans]TFF34106.1 carboxypeptidase regulatory-like domain-containing protein [Mucilaginibacter psychrotolerans]
MNLKRFAFFILILVACTPVFAQRDTIGLTTIVAKTTKLVTSYPFEKVYLHLDKPYYAAGDTIWFKAYVTIDQHSPTILSNIVYVDITNSQDSMMRYLKLPVVNGVANGNIGLTTAEFKQGNYHLRAYTAYMRNYDPDYFFNKNLVIGNAVDKTVATNIAFTSTAAAAGLTKVNAGITYFDPKEGLALAGKKVTWTVVANNEDLSKGKGTTDQNGVLKAEFSGAATALKGANLVAVIDMGNRTSVTRTFPLKAAASDKDIQFFPEGGELITGVRSKVAFKAIGNNGLGINIKGTITDNDGNVVANLASQHLGMGVFALIPEAGKTYKANIEYADGSKSTYDLPRIKASGINLSVFNNDSENLSIKISANSTYFPLNQGKLYYIIAQSGGAVYFAAQTKLDAPIYSASIPKNKFPTGIVQLTLLTDHGVALCERVVFIQHNDALTLNINSATKSYAIRQKVKLAITAKNKALPVAGTFSVSVIDETKVPFDDNAETTILTSTLLTSDLKGYVEKPNYYFISKDVNAAENLDILMLTQGYRRLSYRNVITDKVPQIMVSPEQNGLELSGVLRNNTGMTIAKGYLRLQIPSRNFYAETVTDMVGNYHFSKLNFNDSSKVIITARANANGKNLVVTANPETYQAPTRNNMAFDEVANIDTTMKNFLLNSLKQYNNLHQLKEVVIRAAPAKKVGHTDFPALTGLPMMADQEIAGSVLRNCTNMALCLQSYLLGTTVDDNKLYFMKSYNSQNKKPIQIFLNGMPVDLMYLNSVNTANVESIEVFKTPGLSGIDDLYGTSGIVEINLKKQEKGTKISFADLQELIPPPNILTIMPTGYAVAREFYSPKYDVPKPGTFGGDLRSTIFWSPKVLTDKVTGSTFVEFYNADGRGTYKAVIEGMDADGNLGRYVYRYTVK